jgi:hypothetical protein
MGLQWADPSSCVQNLILNRNRPEALIWIRRKERKKGHYQNQRTPLKITAFWNVTPDILVELLAVFLPWLLFDLEDGSSMMLRNVDGLLPDSTLSRPKTLLPPWEPQIQQSRSLLKFWAMTIKHEYWLWCYECIWGLLCFFIYCVMIILNILEIPGILYVWPFYCYKA